jgi:hypothetical protein
MAEIVFPLTTAPGKNPTESGGRLINARVEYAPPGTRSKHVWRPVSGLRETIDVGADVHRGALKLGSTLLVVNDELAYSVTKAAGVYTPVALTGDAISGEGRVIMARNMKVTPQVMVVTESGVSLIESGTVADFTDADLPAPNSVCFKDGFFFFGIGDGRCFASGINAETVASTDWTRAESSPDGLVRVFALPSGIALAGENSTEIFANTAEPTGFPFSRAAVLPFGLFGQFAVTGFEEGFSGDPLVVANDGSVHLIRGFSSEKVSTSDLEAMIVGISDRTTLTASCYMDGGQSVYVLSCADWTWEFSPPSNTAPIHWRERASIGDVRWRAGITVGAFDEWLALDETTAAMYRLDSEYRREADEQLVWEVRSTQAHRFPGRAVINKASFDMKTGVGIDVGADPIETNPVVGISWSDDGGITFGNELFRSLGTQAEIVPITINNCGLTRQFGRQWKLRVADPVIVALYGGAMQVEERLAA